MGKYATIVLLALLIIVISVQAFRSFREERVVSGQLRAAKEKMDMLSKENEQLQEQIDYVSRSENLEKELRAKFNYKKPEEKTVIVTP